MVTKARAKAKEGAATTAARQAISRKTARVQHAKEKEKEGKAKEDTNECVTTSANQDVQRKIAPSQRRAKAKAKARAEEFGKLMERKKIGHGGAETSINQKGNLGAVYAGSPLNKQTWRSVLSIRDARLENIRAQIDSGAVDTVGPKEVARAFKIKGTVLSKKGLGHVAAIDRKLRTTGRRG